MDLIVQMKTLSKPAVCEMAQTRFDTLLFKYRHMLVVEQRNLSFYMVGTHKYQLYIAKNCYMSNFGKSYTSIYHWMSDCLNGVRIPTDEAWEYFEMWDGTQIPELYESLACIDTCFKL